MNQARNHGLTRSRLTRQEQRRILGSDAAHLVDQFAQVGGNGFRLSVGCVRVVHRRRGGFACRQLHPERKGGYLLQQLIQLGWDCEEICRPGAQQSCRVLLVVVLRKDQRRTSAPRGGNGPKEFRRLPHAAEASQMSKHEDDFLALHLSVSALCLHAILKLEVIDRTEGFPDGLGCSWATAN